MYNVSRVLGVYSSQIVLLLGLVPIDTLAMAGRGVVFHALYATAAASFVENTTLSTPQLIDAVALP